MKRSVCFRRMTSYSCRGKRRETNLDGAVLASGLEAEDTKGLGNDNLLLAVVGRGNTLKDLQALKGSGSAGTLQAEREGRKRPHLSVSVLLRPQFALLPLRPSNLNSTQGSQRTLWGTIPRMAR
jgi:hypothetical protein